MFYVPESKWPDVRPSPLAGFGEAAKTLADAVIQGREKAAFSQDQTLIGKTLARFNRPGEPQTGYGEESGDPYTIPAQPVDRLAEWEKALGQMQTQKGKTAALAEMMKDQPVPLSAYEGGQIVEKGTRPGRGEMLKTPPEELEDRRQLGRERLEDKKQENQLKRDIQLQEAREAGDWRKYAMIKDVTESRAELREKLRDGKTKKDRGEMGRKHLMDVLQKSKENLARQQGNIRKQFTGFGGDITDKAGYEAALAKAQMEYQQEREMIRSAYADVIQRYGMGAGGKGAAGTEKAPGGDVRPRLWNKKTGQYENVDQETFDAVKQRETGK